MDFVQHKSNTRVLGAPAGWDQDKLPCGALPVTDVEITPGVPCVQSYWQPSADEIESLKEGGFIVLGVIGQTMPPVMMFVVDASRPSGPTEPPRPPGHHPVA